MDPLFVTKIVTQILLPPGCLVLAFVLALIVWRPAPRVARAFALLGIVGLYLSSAPFVAHQLATAIEIYPATSPAALRDRRIQAIVILGGGRRGYAPEHGTPTVSEHAIERLRYGALLHRATRIPLLVTGGVVLGGGPSEAELMAEVLTRDFYVTVRWQERGARNTEGNARLTRAMLDAEGIERIALVSHASHLYRAVEMFEDQGFEVLPAPTVFWGDPRPQPTVWTDFLPGTRALVRVRLLLHEFVGRIWYRLRRA